MSVKVIKVNGEKEDYSEDKIRSSASRVGVPRDLQDQMIGEIRSKLYDGIKTAEIFRIIKSYLASSDSPHLAAKYNLKKALAELGPSGYPFEQFVAALLSAIGYKTTTNQVLQGHCVTHEVDVIAQKDGVKYFIEAKFHKNPSQRTDVKVALYIHSRYLDLAEQKQNGGNTAPWIVTNTRFSTDALSYANCRDIRITSWGYPKGEGIMDLIEQTRLHPVTMLEGLTHDDKVKLLSANIVTCRQLITDKSVYNLISKRKLDNIIRQASAICGNS